MPIRPATHEDLPALAALGQRFFEYSEYGRFVRFDPKAARLALVNLLSGAGVVLVAEVDGVVVGGVCGVVSSVWFAPETKTGVELAWWVDPQARGTAGVKLVRAFETWARERGASMVVLCDMVLRNSEPAGALIERLGYSQVERSHFKEL